MTKKTETKVADPFAAVRQALVETVDAVTEGQEQVTELAQTELAKAKDVAAEQAEKAQAAVQANVDAAVAAGEVVAAGAEKVGTLVHDEVNAVAEARIAAVKQVINAKTFKDVIDVQTALIKAEQQKAVAFVEAVAKLTEKVANDAAKPVQKQIEKNLKALNVKAA